jgi:hypothetical protein
MSPFDIAKGLLNTKELILDDILTQHYVPFMINRILSNSAQTAFFAEAIDGYSGLDKKLQYDFYFHGIKKSNARTAWNKKETESDDTEIINYLAEKLNVNIKRATEYLKVVPKDKIEAEMNSKGGKAKRINNSVAT